MINKIIQTKKYTHTKRSTQTDISKRNQHYRQTHVAHVAMSHKHTGYAFR